MLASLAGHAPHLPFESVPALRAGGSSHGHAALRISGGAFALRAYARSFGGLTAIAAISASRRACRRGRVPAGALALRARRDLEAPAVAPSDRRAGRREALLAPVAAIGAFGRPSRALAGGAGPTAPGVASALWGERFAAQDVDRWLAAFAEDCVYEDLYYAEPFVGRAAVARLLAEKVLPQGSRLVLDRVSDGIRSCGFTWHVEQDGVGVGQRGLSFLRLDDAGRIAYVREVGEPLFKAGELTEQLLKALTKDQPPPAAQPATSARNETPTTAGSIVRYLYGTVQQAGGDAVRFYSQDVVYEDMNYDRPFVGKPAVADFLNRFQTIQGVTFNLEEVSDGSQAVGFTYTIDIKGQPRGVRGITFYEVDRQGLVCYVRDVPESPAKPPPVQWAARLVRPGLRRLQPADPLPGDIAGKDPLLA